MHFPADRDADTFPWQGRKIYMGPTAPGDEPVAMAAAVTEFTFVPDPDPLSRAVNAPLNWYEGPTLHRRGLEEVQRFIPLVEQRLELNARLLEEMPAKVDAQRTLVENNKAKVTAAYADVQRLLEEDRDWLAARGGIFKQSGWIMEQHMVIAPEVWLPRRQCELRATTEWRRYELLKSRAQASTSPETQAVHQLGILEQQLAHERKLKSLLESRLFDLRKAADWWRREALELLGETA